MISTGLSGDGEETKTGIGRTLVLLWRADRASRVGVKGGEIQIQS
jgi:hypothetical protein